MNISNTLLNFMGDLNSKYRWIAIILSLAYFLIVYLINDKNFLFKQILYTYMYFNKISKKRYDGVLIGYYMIVLICIIITILLLGIFFTERGIFPIIFGITGILYLFLCILLGTIIYKLIRYPHLFRHDIYPAYRSLNGNINIIVETIHNKALIISLVPSDFNKLNHIKRVSLNDKRYLKDLNSVMKMGIYYIKNDQN